VPRARVPCVTCLPRGPRSPSRLAPRAPRSAPRARASRLLRHVSPPRASQPVISRPAPRLAPRVPRPAPRASRLAPLVPRPAPAPRASCVTYLPRGPRSPSFLALRPASRLAPRASRLAPRASRLAPRAPRPAPRAPRPAPRAPRPARVSRGVRVARGVRAGSGVRACKGRASRALFLRPDVSVLGAGARGLPRPGLRMLSMAWHGVASLGARLVRCARLAGALVAHAARAGCGVRTRKGRAARALFPRPDVSVLWVGPRGLAPFGSRSSSCPDAEVLGGWGVALTSFGAGGYGGWGGVATRRREGGGLRAEPPRPNPEDASPRSRAKARAKRGLFVRGRVPLPWHAWGNARGGGGRRREGGALRAEPPRPNPENASPRSRARARAQRGLFSRGYVPLRESARSAAFRARGRERGPAARPGGAGRGRGASAARRRGGRGGVRGRGELLGGVVCAGGG
jgi:hypothetical protein